MEMALKNELDNLISNITHKISISPLAYLYGMNVVREIGQNNAYKYKKI